MKKAFTLFEIIMVIVILGIIGAITTDIIGTLFRNYNNQLVLNDLTLKTSNALSIITKRLDRSIKESIAYESGGTRTDIRLKVISATNKGDLLLWLGKDIESFQRDGNLSKNGYSGFIDIPNSAGTLMKAAESNETIIQSIEGNLTGSAWSGADNTETTALYFPYATEDDTVADSFYNYSIIVGAEKPSALFPIRTMTSNGNNVDITLDRQPDTIVERFYLTYGAYALELDSGQLWLYYDFQPWQGETRINGRREPIIDHVTSFKFWSEGEGSVIRLQLCVTNDRYMGGGDDEINFCNESAIIR